MTYWFVTFSCKNSDGATTAEGNIHVKSNREELSLRQLVDYLDNKYGGKAIITFFREISKKSFDELNQK